jgi:hypothetical protein
MAKEEEYDSDKDCKMDRIVVYIKHIGEKIDRQEIIDLLEENMYLMPTVGEITTTSIGPWTDDHELNYISATPEQYEKYFKK